MDSVRIRNLRNLKDTGIIDIKPLTFLLGSNSSGKSTFLRSFPLLKQSVSAKTTGPILWYGDLVDFGGFDKAVNNSAESSNIYLSYNFSLNINNFQDLFMARSFKRLAKKLDQGKLKISIQIGLTTDDNPSKNTVCSTMKLALCGHEVYIRIDKKRKVSSFEINGIDVLTEDIDFDIEQIDHFIPQVAIKSKVKKSNTETYPQGKMPDLSFWTIPSIASFIEPLTGYRAKNDKNKKNSSLASFLARSVTLDSPEAILKNIKKLNESRHLKRQLTKTWEGNVEKWEIGDPHFNRLQSLIVANYISVILMLCDFQIKSFANDICYMGPIRATAERYYRSQDFAVGDVDYRGENLAMFLRNLTKSERKEFAIWTEENFSFSVEINAVGDHVSLEICQRNKNRVNLADTGFGFSQILPVLTQLWWLQKKKKSNDLLSEMFESPITFTIEQPELHLHPNLQSLLSNTFMKTIHASKKIGIDLRIIIETHSQTLLNKVGQSIAENEFDANDVNVVLFNEDEAKDLIKITTTTFDEEGYLIDWPLGFFEA